MSIKKEVGHTMGPWKIDINERVGGFAIDGNTTSPRSICLVENEADAQFIVKACNSHEELLTGAKELLNLINNSEKIIKLEQIIKKAEGN